MFCIVFKTHSVQRERRAAKDNKDIVVGKRHACCHKQCNAKILRLCQYVVEKIWHGVRILDILHYDIQEKCQNAQRPE